MATTRQYVTSAGVVRNEKTDRVEYVAADGTVVNETTAAAGGGGGGVGFRCHS
jgi:hypothetical protein